MEGKEEYEMVPCQKSSKSAEAAAGGTREGHGLRWEAELVYGGDYNWEGYKSWGKNLICSYCQGTDLGKVNGVGPE